MIFYQVQAKDGLDVDSCPFVDMYWGYFPAGEC